MVIKGKVHKLGNDINTDDIIAAKYLVWSDAEELGKHCLESIKPDFISKVSPGDIIVAGKNFGCGSSREHAPLAIKGCGVSAVVAKSFAAIFFRNAINIGLPFLELEEVDPVRNTKALREENKISNGVDKIQDGDVLEIDLSSGIIKNITQNQTYKTQAFPEFLQEIVKEGGLMNYIKAQQQGLSPKGTVPAKRIKA